MCAAPPARSRGPCPCAHGSPSVARPRSGSVAIGAVDFESDGLRIHYELHGKEDGRPIVLVHGFASHYRLNWVGTRWQEKPTEACLLSIGLHTPRPGPPRNPHQPSAKHAPRISQ